jgi:ABC-type uncharacterized transport system YnjBCD permease subunit
MLSAFLISSICAICIVSFVFLNYTVTDLWCAWLIDGFRVDDRIYCALTQLLTTFYKQLYDTLCLFFSIIFDCGL